MTSFQHLLRPGFSEQLHLESLRSRAPRVFVSLLLGLWSFLTIALLSLSFLFLPINPEISFPSCSPSLVLYDGFYVKVKIHYGVRNLTHGTMHARHVIYHWASGPALGGKDFWTVHTIWREYIFHDFSGSLFQTFCPNILIAHMNWGSYPDLQLVNGLGTISLSVLWDGGRPKWLCVKFLSSRHFLIQSQSLRWSDPSKHQVWHACRDNVYKLYNV